MSVDMPATRISREDGFLPVCGGGGRPRVVLEVRVTSGHIVDEWYLTG